MAHDVFISHSVKDKVTADAVCAMLESAGIRCWIAPRDVMPGMEWGECIIEAIEQTRVMVLVFTADANASPQIRREVERAVNHGVAILPLRMEDVLPGKALEYFIGNVHWLDALTPPFEAHLKNLAGTIKILLARTEPGAPSAPLREEKPPSSNGQGAAGGTPERAGAREKAPAPRRFWSVRAWTWAPGAITVLLLVGVFIGVHFSSRPAPVTSPEPITSTPQSVPGAAEPGGATPLTPAPAGAPKPAAKTPGAAPGNAASLRDTMSNLQKELGGIGTTSYTLLIWNKAEGKSFQETHVYQVSNVVADLAQCHVSYHRRISYDGGAPQDRDYEIALHDVTSVVVEPIIQRLTEVNVGQTNLVFTSSTPPVTALVVRLPGRLNGVEFTNADLANRTAETLKQAVKLCGGTLAN
ncbi:MAG: toll/interleukin-1 receptor domain-containing protein [Terracidiphilus sp.]|jgi:hypothetical protein